MKPAASRFRDISEEVTTMPRDTSQPHPGLVLREEFLEPLGISAHALARAIDVPGTTATGRVIQRCSVAASQVRPSCAAFFIAAE